ncbi:ABC transporter ATP-binding protein [Rhizocola hellebori]|uniref:ABC transporter ATP-binding protein n=1 Tax=Rhizocola hellebori TaxID=1392758 RepID=A0A8J3Q4Q6_9ACTN|nr:ABC transporter ATP-binding protein [Rhizocola hellebori]GIH03293.1 ABC transporter ATP-binding protein [Rhizocola hellebori]
MNDPVLQAEGLVRSYGKTQALRGLSVTIASGEIVAVSGPSGCGKSTLLHCLAGIIVPDSGAVRYRGQPLGEMSEKQRSRLRRTSFGVLFQFGQLVAELPAVDNVGLPLLLGGYQKRIADSKSLEWLQRLGVAEVASALPSEMSGGQAQRVALARAMVTEPEVLFADEPTGALDSLAGEQVLEVLTSHARQRNMTVVLVTHDAKVAAYADREVLLRDGAQLAAEVPA